MNKNIKKLLLILILIIVIFPLIYVEAEIITDAESGESFESDSCGGGICMNSEFWDIVNDKNGGSSSAMYGVRVTFVNQDKQKLSYANVVNYWATDGMRNFFVNEVDYKVSDSTIKNYYVDGTGLNVSYLHRLDEGSGSYADYLQSLNYDKIKAFLTQLVKDTRYNTKVDIDLLDDVNLYLRFEPIYVMHLKVHDDHYYIGGTTEEILEMGSGLEYGAEYVKTYLGETPRYWFKYISGIRDILDKKYESFYDESVYETGEGPQQNYNVMKNFITTTYYEKNTHAAGIIENITTAINKNTTEDETKWNDWDADGKVDSGVIYTGFSSQWKGSMGTTVGVGYVRILDKITPCISEFNSFNGDGTPITMLERVSLYVKYLNSAPQRNYRALLDSSNNTGDKACKSKSCTKNVNLGCLSVSSTKISDFNVNNVSCYNKTIKVDGKTGYCRVEFDLVNNFKGYYDFTSTFSFTDENNRVEPGQMIIRRSALQRTVAKGQLVETCYVYDSFAPGALPNNNLEYENYISNVKFGGEELITEEDSIFSTGWEPVSVSIYSRFKKSIGVNYKLSQVFITKGDAKLASNGSVNKISLDYGIMSKLNEKPLVTHYLGFSLNVNDSSLIASSGVQFDNYACYYNLSPGLIDPELKLEFRVIDTKNPFQSKDGNPRRVGKNWAMNYSGGTLIKPANISNFKNGNTDMRYDYTGDKIVNMLDYYAYLGSEIDSNCTTKNMSDNCLILGVMESTNNSYNKNNKRKPMYKITLTPDTILEIREYNKANEYDDLNMSVNYHTGKYMSEFLNELSSGKVSGESVTGTFLRG